MNEELQDQITEYEESLQSLREEGQALSRNFKQQGWRFIPSLLDIGYQPCFIHPDLWAKLKNDDGIAYDDEDEFYYLQGDITTDQWKMIVLLPVF